MRARRAPDVRHGQAVHRFVDDSNANHYHVLMHPEPPSRLVSAASTTSAAANPPVMRRVSSHDLLGACGQLVITHGGREYRLRVTQNNKLILTA
jgi:hemin uptake protein HemP